MKYINPEKLIELLNEMNEKQSENLLLIVKQLELLQKRVDVLEHKFSKI